MINPWNDINLQHYESHMASESVMQLQMLDVITKEQLEKFSPAKVAILGAAGGNGLSHIDSTITKEVYAIDINQNFLSECSSRYTFLNDRLKTLCLDLSDRETSLPETDLLICNLIVEYLGEETFSNLLVRNSSKIKAVSVVFQENELNSFVSESEYSMYLNSLEAVHHDVDKRKLVDCLSKTGFNTDFSKEYILPNGKKLVRIDFIMRLFIDSFVTYY